MSYKVGLTGGIGSGKTTVAHLFAELGVPVIDTDTISHQLTQADGAAIPAIKAGFGADYINADNALDRAKMRQLVFSDISARKKLEAILHPQILAQAKAQANSTTAPYVLIVIPLLFETGHYQDWLQRTLAVDCPEQLQIDRVTRRNGLDEPAVRAIMAQQISRLQRIKLADDTILNDTDLDGLKRQVTALHQHYLELSQRSN